MCWGILRVRSAGLPSILCWRAYLAGLAADMRIIIDNRIHQIISGPATLGRRNAMEIMVEEHSSEGAAP